MKIITVESVRQLLKKHGFNNYLLDLMQILKKDFAKWDSFTNIPRPAMHVPNGVLELMPICDNEIYYSFKYVNCHPKNPLVDKQTVIATGQLSQIDTGYPLLFSEMTVLTALRTAAITALATDLMSRKDAKVVAIIGTGAQSEFQIKALQLVREIVEVRFFDIDQKAMDKFEKNMNVYSFRLIRCKNAQEAVAGADIITVCTACKANVDVLKNKWIRAGVHINALGGDTIGKTELELSILSRSHIVVEYFEQSFIEGEIQRLSKKKAKKLVYAELHEIITAAKKGRITSEEITLFDSVGIALEDYSVLRLTYELAEKYHIGEEMNFIPVLTDQKDLMSLVL
ncbi:MAG TPA: ornithine cyclodeaminase [Candidatus Sulfotelmatobacter sp.]|jgi:ornithine cyclodeaminase|nr:ornithine cyclodeaminase [Candidatus Sulfotelmatobacter sp.]